MFPPPQVVSLSRFPAAAQELGVDKEGLTAAPAEPGRREQELREGRQPLISFSQDHFFAPPAEPITPSIGLDALA
jgi:hypothetical protein